MKVAYVVMVGTQFQNQIISISYGVSAEFSLKIIAWILAVYIGIWSEVAELPNVESNYTGIIQGVLWSEILELSAPRDKRKCVWGTFINQL